MFINGEKQKKMPSPWFFLDSCKMRRVFQKIRFITGFATFSDQIKNFIRFFLNERLFPNVKG